MSRTKLGSGLGLGLKMHKTINRRTRRREVAIACARATSPLPWAADGGYDLHFSKFTDMLTQQCFFFLCKLKCVFDLCTLNHVRLGIQRPLSLISIFRCYHEKLSMVLVVHETTQQ